MQYEILWKNSFNNQILSSLTAGFVSLGQNNTSNKRLVKPQDPTIKIIGVL
jgi:hypothetical protein